MDGDEVVQAYIQYPDLEQMPLKELTGFQQVHIVNGAEKRVEFRIPASELQKWNPKHKQWKLYPGQYKVVVDRNSQERCSAHFTVS